MKERVLRMGPILVTLLRPTEPAFRTEPCPDLDPDQRLDPTFWAERLEKLPTIPADTPVEIGNFTVRVGSLRWTYEYFSSYYRKTVRSECPWLYHEWEVRWWIQSRISASIWRSVPGLGMSTSQRDVRPGIPIPPGRGRLGRASDAGLSFTCARSGVLAGW